jgi:hypothetical protein
MHGIKRGGGGREGNAGLAGRAYVRPEGPTHNAEVRTAYFQPRMESGLIRLGLWFSALLLISSE